MAGAAARGGFRLPLPVRSHAAAIGASTGPKSLFAMPYVRTYRLTMPSTLLAAGLLAAANGAVAAMLATMAADAGAAMANSPMAMALGAALLIACFAAAVSLLLRQKHR